MADAYRCAAEIRVIVGYLAEQKEVWVSSQFFGPRAAAFLAPLFARTAFQAQCHGVAAALARLHDEHIGVGRTHHLFRLPEVLEEGIATALNDRAFATVLQQEVQSPETAVARLRHLSKPGKATEGAVAVAGEFSDDPTSILKVFAGLYMDAFERGLRTYPFVRES